MNQETSKSVLLLVALAVTGVVYSVGLSGPFVFDDIDNLRPLNRWLSGELSWLRVVLDNESGQLGRPISMASFVFNVWLFGPSIWGFKVTNLVIHLVNGLLLYKLFALLLQRDTSITKASRAAHWLPLVGATIWLLHPLFVSTVLYVVQRMAMLSATFVLMTMIAYVLGRVALESGGKRRALFLLLVITPLCTLLASFSKENGILALAFCAMIEWLAFAPPKHEKRSWPSRLVLLFGLGIPAAIAVSLVLIQPSFITDGYANRPFTLTERLLTQTRVLWSYVSSLVLPFGPRLGLYHDDFPISHSLFNPWTTALAILGWVATALVAWFLRRSAPGFTLGIGVFLIGHSMESSVFPLLMYFEHRNYLPSIGLIWGLLSIGVLAARHLAPMLDHGKKIAALSSISLVLVLGAATAARSYIWQSQEALLLQGLKHHPTSRWLRIDLAQEAMYRSPPAYGEARSHADSLVNSTDDSTRRMAGAWQVMISCAEGTPVKPESLHLAFGGNLRIMEADLLITFESLGNNVTKMPCPDLTQLALAEAFVAMLDNASLDPRHFSSRRLRFKASQLFWAASDLEKALEHARLAYTGSKSDAPIGIFLADLEAYSGNLTNAAALILQLDDQIPDDDKTGRRMLLGIQEFLKQRGRPADVSTEDDQ